LLFIKTSFHTIWHYNLVEFSFLNIN
jgi:hypothetical protein